MQARLLLTPHDLLAAAQRFVPADLVDRRAYQRMVRAVDGLPAGFSGFFIEAPLRARGARADILLGTLASSRGRLELARAARWPASVRANPVWQRVLAFFAAWASPGANSLASIPLALLELDLHEGRPREPRIPGLHVCIAPGFAADGWEVPNDAPPGPDGARTQQIVADVLALTAGQPPPLALMKALRRCRRALPARGRLLHVSSMLSRPAAPYKLNALIPRDRLAHWLPRVGWPGRLRDLEDLVARFGMGAPLIKLDMALAPDVGAPIGFEVSLPGDPRREPRWRVLFDALVADGLCTDDQARGLADWYGEARIQPRGAGWPVVLDRALNVKLVAHGDGAVDAKAYLGFSPRFSLRDYLGRTVRATARTAVRVHARRTRLANVLAEALDRDARGPALELPAALVSEAARTRLLEAARALPNACTSWCLECRLAPGEQQVDLLGCITANDGGRARLRPTALWPLSRIAGLARRWKDPASALRDAVRFLWVEADLPLGETTLSAPSVYVGLEPRPVPESGGRLARTRWTPRALRGLIGALAEAAEAPISAAAARTALSCVGSLPPGAQLNCLGLMRSRPDAGLRLSLELPPGALSGYLAGIGWRGPERDLRFVQSLIARGVDRLALSIDSRSQVGPRLGFELFYYQPPHLDRRFASVLADLEKAQLCSPEKRAGLLDWRGEVDVAGGRLDRTVYHVKLVVEDGARLMAKSYLWLTTVGGERGWVS